MNNQNDSEMQADEFKTFTAKKMPADLHQWLKETAKTERRSMEQQVLFLLESAKCNYTAIGNK